MAEVGKYLGSCFLLFLLRLSCSKANYSLNGTVYYTAGWDELNVISGTGKNTSYDDQTIMFAAGYLEGALTAQRINENYVNNYDIFFSKSSESYAKRVGIWFDSHEKWMRSKIASGSNSSAVWRQMGNIVSQYDGLIAGYTDHPATDKVPSKSFLYCSNLQSSDGMMGHHFFLLIAMVLTVMFILFWFEYSATMRIYKHYYFNLGDPSTGAKWMSFSSYAGYLESLDDFYIMDSGLIMLQTTNSMFNNSLLKYVSPKSLLAWHRVRLANLMAIDGQEWAEVYKQYNSVSGDQTEIFSEGYWPSYNIPFYEMIYNLSGFPEFVKKHGLSYSYQLAPRAKIFRRDQGKLRLSLRVDQADVIHAISPIWMKLSQIEGFTE